MSIALHLSICTVGLCPSHSCQASVKMDAPPLQCFSGAVVSAEKIALNTDGHLPYKSVSIAQQAITVREIVSSDNYILKN